MNQTTINEAKSIFNWILNHRRHLHKYPELSFQEFKTSEYIKNVLNELGIPFKSLAETGIVGMIGTGENCVALRADMDALPINEETNLECSSVNNGVMHACGHDFHISMLLGAAKILKENEQKLNGSVKLIFQPGEEKIPGGASLMIKEGVLENPKPKIIFGQHINPAIETGKVSTTSGPIMASADELYWSVKGKQVHAAQPHLGNDPIIASAQMILSFQTIISKFRNPLSPAVLSVTSVHGGSATNIIPELVEMKGTLRFFNNEERFATLKKIDEIGQSIASIYNVTSEFNPLIGYPPLVNNEHAVSTIRKVAYEMLGDEGFENLSPIMWAEDFAYYAEKIPACFFFLGVKPHGTDDMPQLHNSKLSPDENALIYGTAMFVASAMSALKN